MTTAYQGSRFVSGLDLGQAQDFTAFVVLEESWRPAAGDEDKLHPQMIRHYSLRHLERFELGTSYPAIVDSMAERFESKELRTSRLAVDQTGVGRAVVDMLRARDIDADICPITITGGHEITYDAGEYRVPKKELVSILQVFLQSRRLQWSKQFPEAETLAKELLNFKVKITLAANETFEGWRERDHDDLVLAVALACWLAEHTAGSYETFAPYVIGHRPWWLTAPYR